VLFLRCSCGWKTKTEGVCTYPGYDIVCESEKLLDLGLLAQLPCLSSLLGLLNPLDVVLSKALSDRTRRCTELTDHYEPGGVNVTLAMALKTLRSYFPLTLPVPSPLTHPDLITAQDLHREEDLLRNPSSFRAWWTAIHNARETYNAQLKIQRPPDLSVEVTALLGPLASPHARISLQRLTYLYESALVHFPNSFKLWKSYLQMRMSYLLGKLVVKKRAGGKKKLPEMKDALEEEKEDLEVWEGGLDGVIGLEEWKSLVSTFERALMWIPNVRTLLCRLFAQLTLFRN
jgi:hypothetical protein